MIQYARPIGPDTDGVVVHARPPMEITTEDGDVVWLPTAWFDTAGKAKQAAVSQFDLADRFIDVRCRREWLRCEERWEDGYRLDACAWCDEIWYPCSPIDEHAHEFWRLEAV